MLLVLIAAAIAAPNPGTIDAPRRAFSTCIRKFEAQAVSDKMALEAYGGALKAACASESTALSNALVAYDVAMGTKRAKATANAAADVDDYLTTSTDRFRDKTAPQ